MSILVHNTLTGRKEEFIPQEDKKIKMYVCGITPYDTCHLGHARCYVVFDVIRRYLEYRGYQVEYVQNFTDIDDKIIKRSQELGVKPEDLAEKYVQEFLLYSEKLNLKPPKAYPRVTQMMPQIIQTIEGLVKKGYAYEKDGNVFYAVRKFIEYGKLSKRNLESMTEEFRRIEPDERKNDPLDFALWKASKEGEPSWDSPWGKGRPGWHIECSTMSMEYLGETLDIHGGGQDLIFPHHENEIAQSEAYTGKQFVRYWLHNGFVTINKEKMSKSLGNFFTLEEIFQKYDPMVVRYYLISQHYRSPLDFSDTQLNQAKSAWERVCDTKEEMQGFIRDGNLTKGNVMDSIRIFVDDNIQTFRKSMDDDFNTSGGIAVVHNLISNFFDWRKKLFSGMTEDSLKYLFENLHSLTDILGLVFPTTKKNLSEEEKGKIGLYREAKEQRNYKKSDVLREETLTAGEIKRIEDLPDGRTFVQSQDGACFVISSDTKNLKIQED